MATATTAMYVARRSQERKAFARTISQGDEVEWAMETKGKVSHTSFSSAVIPSIAIVVIE